MWGANKRATISDEVHDENTKLDGKLLNDDDRATSILFGDLSEIHGHLGAGNADTDAIDDTARNQLTNRLGGHLDGSATEPPETGKHD